MEEKTVSRIREMEAILDDAARRMDELEAALRAYLDCQGALNTLERYYTGPDWREDLALDEAGRLPAALKRGVLSEDGIYNLLERNRELLERLGAFVGEGEQSAP